MTARVVSSAYRGQDFVVEICPTFADACACPKPIAHPVYTYGWTKDAGDPITFAKTCARESLLLHAAPRSEPVPPLADVGHLVGVTLEEAPGG